MSTLEDEEAAQQVTSTGQGPTGTVHCTVDETGIATLRLGEADEGVVTLTLERLESLDAALQALARDARVRGVLLTGPGPGMFCAGADIRLIQDITTVASGEAAAERGRSIYQRCQQLRVPVVAAIEGPCLGGGLELALFCDVRVASDHRSTQIGLPEVKLGIVPGFGGTQTLSRLVGLPIALDLILNGKLLRGKQAKRLGVVDRLVPAPKLLAAARQELDKLVQAGRKRPRRRLRGLAFWLSRTPLRSLAVRQARKALQKGQARFYPAPKAALQCCLDAFTQSRARGFAAEARTLGQMIVTPVSKGLTHLFFLTERSKRLGKADGAKALDRALVVGGGVMGAGIAGLFAGHGMRVRLCDVDLQALARGKARLQQDLIKKVRRRHLERHEAQAVQDRLAVGTEWGQLQDTGLWLEAVVEDLDVKRRLMAEAVARGLPATAVLATNTSSLSVTAMAADVPQPERVVGIHFFNPPEKMPLVEVIRGRSTSDATVATACRLAIRLGKFPVVTTDSPGFLVNRCLAPYVNEAARLLVEGTSPEAIDAAMLDFGMPMGPCRLLDEIGFDVAAKVSSVMQAAFPQRMEPCELFAAMADARVLGSKSGGGIYGADGTGRGPGRNIVATLAQRRGTPPRQASRSELVHRLIYPLVDEAYRCVDEGIVAGEEDVDLGLVMGIGFPPFTGGITQFARREGLATVVATLDELARSLGARFLPADGLRRRAVN
ncbi:MAG TPA: 3-hydroxyacyl-CoA dehydrogenase NAD-binding domain-containing protein [Planctomycetota bacterium]|nr:3-hydroxyacyl-CoA dehydrogenase NAD-binding domain-containing protein [Planctomycetota bacterium]